MASSQMSVKRIHREIADLKKPENHMGDITLEPTGDSLYVFKGKIPGPEGSVYEGGVYEVEIQLAPEYPFSAPKAIFKTRIYHMNISDKGAVCIDILKQNWSPALSLSKVMLSLSSLLTDPNPKDPLVPNIAMEYVKDRARHDRTARQWTDLYAKPKPPPKPVVKQASAASKAKGKQKAASDTIELSDDEVQVVARPPAKRKRTPAPSETIVISDDEEDGGTRRSKRRTAAPISRTQRPGPTSTPGEQVVIEID